MTHIVTAPNINSGNPKSSQILFPKSHGDSTHQLRRSERLTSQHDLSLKPPPNSPRGPVGPEDRGAGEVRLEAVK